MLTTKKTKDRPPVARKIATHVERRVQGYRNRIMKVTLPTLKFTEPKEAEEVHA